jgi:hypothetical protein
LATAGVSWPAIVTMQPSHDAGEIGVGRVQLSASASP